MNILKNPNVEFVHAGLFQGTRPWIHAKRMEKTYEIIYVTKGEVWLEDNGTEYALNAGSLLLLPPDTMHQGTRASTGVAFYWVHFHVEGKLPFEKRYFERFENSALFRELLHYNNLPTVPTVLVNAILMHILATLDAVSAKNATPYDEKAERICEWVRIHAVADLRVSQVAENFGHSPDHITRICKRTYGVGVKELATRFLLERAKFLLCNTNKYVKEIAAELNFANDKAFIGFFKYHEKCYPADFRKRFGKTHMNSR